MTIPCGSTVKAAQIQESFAFGLSNPRWIVDTGTVDAGSGVITTNSDTAAPVRYHWQCPVDLTSSSIFINAAPDLDVNTFYSFSLMADSANYVSFVVVGSNPNAMRFRMCRAGKVTDTFTNYNPIPHAWWKLSEAGGLARWDVSDTGHSWVNQRVATHGMDLSAVTIVFANGAHVLDPGFGGGLFGIGNPGFGD